MPSKQELQKIDNDLKNNSATDKILIDRRGYYIYYNKPTRTGKPLKVHRHYCGECRWGAGKHDTAINGERGVWIGPFEKDEFIDNFIEENFQDLVDHIDKTCGCLK